MQLNNKQQRWLALGLLLAIILIIGSAIFMPWYSAVSAMQEDTESLIFRIKRYERIIASRDQVMRGVEQARNDVNSRGYFYEQKTASLAAAALQEHIKKIINHAGGDLSSIQVLPQKTERELVRITVKIRLSGSMQMLRRLLFEIDTDKPLMHINSITIIPSVRRLKRKTIPKEESGQVTVTAEVSAYMKKDRHEPI